MSTIARRWKWNAGEARVCGRTDGTEYLDCVQGISTNGLGHAHPVLVEAVKAQAEKLWHVSNIYKIPGQEALADMLAESSSPTWSSSPTRAPRRSSAR